MAMDETALVKHKFTARDLAKRWNCRLSSAKRIMAKSRRGVSGASKRNGPPQSLRLKEVLRVEENALVRECRDFRADNSSAR